VVEPTLLAVEEVMVVEADGSPEGVEECVFKAADE